MGSCPLCSAEAGSHLPKAVCKLPGTSSDKARGLALGVGLAFGGVSGRGELPRERRAHSQSREKASQLPPRTRCPVSIPALGRLSPGIP